MLRFEWNGLRVGDKVLVHDAGSAELALVSGTVATVNTRKGSNGVAIRVAAAGGGAVVWWPARFAVHLDPRDPTERCWRCEGLTHVVELRSGAPEDLAGPADHKLYRSRRSA